MGQYRLVADPNANNPARVQALVNDFNSRPNSSQFLNLTNRPGSGDLYITDNPQSSLFSPANSARIQSLGPNLNGYSQALGTPTQYINFDNPEGKPALNILVHEIGHEKWPGLGTDAFGHDPRFYKLLNDSMIELGIPVDPVKDLRNTPVDNIPSPVPGGGNPLNYNIPRTRSDAGDDANSADLASNSDANWVVTTSDDGTVVTENLYADPEDGGALLTTIRYETEATGGGLEIKVDTNGDGAWDTNRTIAADGSHTDTEFDPLDTQTWSERSTDYDALGRTDDVTTRNDDGTSNVRDLDQNNTQTWSEQNTDYDALGRADDTTTLNDDGTRNVTDFDQNNTQSWSDFTDTYNAAGSLSSETTNWDNDSWSTTTWDTSGLNNWSSYTDNYNADGSLWSETTDWDNGSWSTTNWDTAGVNGWSSFTDNYNADGSLWSETTDWDNGSWSTTNWDTASVNGWSEFTDNYNADGSLWSEYTNWDDGSSSNDYWDTSGLNSWSSYTDAYDANGNLFNETTLWDDGTAQSDNWDASGQNWWSTFTDNYDANGNMTYEYGGLDTGYSWDTSFDAGNEYYWTNDTGLYDSTSNWAWWDQQYDTGYNDYYDYNTFDSYSWDSYSGFDGWMDAGFPVVLDLEGTGIDLKTLDQSTAWFDMNGDGTRDHTAWAGSSNGILAFDRNGDGEINRTDELAFAHWTDGATSDLDGLRRAMDANQDGVLNADDAGFDQFKVWQDKNQDGVAGDAELKSLADWDIIEIGLVPTGGPTALSDGSAINGTASFKRGDASTGTVGDVAFQYDATNLQALTHASRLIQTTSSFDSAPALDLTVTANDPGAGGSASDVIHNADGSRSETSYDTLNQYSWTSSVISYDSEGRKTAEDNRYDDGTRRVEVWDAENQYSWSYSANFYDSAGTKKEENLTWDDNSHSSWHWDTQNQHSWNSAYDYYDSAGNKQLEEKEWDDGATGIAGNVNNSEHAFGDALGRDSFVFSGDRPSAVVGDRFELDEGLLEVSSATAAAFDQSGGKAEVGVDLPGDALLRNVVLAHWQQDDFRHV
jgi:hypothetical protein